MLQRIPFITAATVLVAALLTGLTGTAGAVPTPTDSARASGFLSLTVWGPGGTSLELKSGYYEPFYADLYTQDGTGAWVRYASASLRQQSNGSVVGEFMLHDGTPIPPGTYRVGVRAEPTYQETFYPSGATVNEGADVVITNDASSSLTLNMRGHIGTIKGRVTLYDGTVTNAIALAVSVYRADEQGNWSTFDLGWGVDMETGAYRVAGLPPGAYRVGVVPRAGGPGTVDCRQLGDVFWPAAPTPASGQPIQIGLGSVVENVDLVIPHQRPSVELSGRPRVGSTLKAAIQSLGSFGYKKPPIYKWYAGKRLIKSGLYRTFAVNKQHLGKRIRVTVTGVTGKTCTTGDSYTTTVRDRSAKVRAKRRR